MPPSLEDLTIALRAFAQERDWGQFHSPKNLASAMSVEAAEVLEHFQWLTEEQSRTLDAAKRNEVGEELADVLMYLLMLSDRLGVDLLDAAKTKLAKNALRYPAEKVRGSSAKASGPSGG